MLPDGVHLGKIGLTISPDLLKQLEKTEGSVPHRLSADAAKATDARRIHLDEKTFRWMHNEDAMAVEKLSEGIRKFNADARELKQYALSRVTQKRPVDRHSRFGRDVAVKEQDHPEKENQP